MKLFAAVNSALPYDLRVSTCPPFYCIVIISPYSTDTATTLQHTPHNYQKNIIQPSQNLTTPHPPFNKKHRTSYFLGVKAPILVRLPDIEPQSLEVEQNTQKRFEDNLGEPLGSDF